LYLSFSLNLDLVKIVKFPSIGLDSSRPNNDIVSQSHQPILCIGLLDLHLLNLVPNEMLGEELDHPKAKCYERVLIAHCEPDEQVSN
jgi:hypothetical protein